ncbi:hypothetical protein Hanom_Chr05g00443121 [Helianthus anomalus]
MVQWLEKNLVFLMTQVKGEYGNTGSSWMGGKVLPIIPRSRLRAGRDRVSAHLGKPRGWRRSSSRRWPHRPVSQWLARRSLPLKNHNKTDKMVNNTFFMTCTKCIMNFLKCLKI